MILRTIRRIMARGQRGLAAPARGDLLSGAQLEAHARSIAAAHRDLAARPRSGDPLRPALARDEQIIAATHQILGADLRRRLPISPASEWLLDNYHIIVEQVRTIRHDLPRGYYRELPKLRGGPYADLPRVYAIACELIAHSDGRIDAALLLRFLNAYQSVTPLRMGEIWAVAIMLRIALVQNLAQLATELIENRRLRAEADVWADRLLASPGGEEGELTTIDELTLRHPTLPVALAAQILRRLRAHEGDRDIGPLVTWLETQPIIPYDSVESLLHAEHQRQAASQVSVGNTINSMRALNSLNWPDWFEQVSLAEQVLRRDPAGVYAASTFATRDRYRHAVEELARRSGQGEEEVARRAVARAQAAPAADLRLRHIGYYLIDRGRPAFASALGYRPPLAELIRDFALDHPTPIYLGAMGGLTTAIVAAGFRSQGLGVGSRGLGVGSRGGTKVSLTSRLSTPDSRLPTPDSRLPTPDSRLPTPDSRLPTPAPRLPTPAPRLLAAALALLPAAALASELVNRAVSHLLSPRVLPRLDLSDGIPAELTSIVVIPTLLLTAESVRHQLDALEVIALANRDPHLHFALLTDFADAPAERMPEDGALIEAVAAHMRELAARHGANRFLLLHRRRVYNPGEGCWMGWERKRGKLEEFNALLAGERETSYGVMVGDLRLLERVRYVITLDADTQLPRDVGQALIGTLAHPLNAARIDPASGRVTEGYGILQPRVGIDLPGATASRFARVFAGNVGIDPYTSAVSDAYMDLFGEGIYAGKGIYDPHAVRASLAGRFPDNTLLSHDLIEGLFARAGLLSDVELLDSYPATYAAWAARLHRWVRGDWQIAAWLLPYTPSARGWRPNDLPIMARYKIFDNLRRSLTPPATLALLLAGWRWLPGRPAAWTALALAHLAAPLGFDLAAALLALAREPGSLGALGARGRDLGLSALRLALNVAFVPDMAALNIDAAARALTRMLITRRRLLEWETAAQSQGRLQRSHAPVLRRSAPLLAAMAGSLALPGRRPRAALAALPVLADWLLAPALAAWLDRPYLRPPRPLGAAERLLLRRLARATWAYFERFVDEEASYLAPDNYQETPRPAVADRTSPTNIGLQLLSDLAAHDMGYIGLGELTARSERALATIEQLDRHRGHLLNWYDTRTLKPLPPAYVSTVDSGNFAAALIALRQGYLALREQPVIGPQALAGLEDTLALAEGGTSVMLATMAGEAGHRGQHNKKNLADYRRAIVSYLARAGELEGAWAAGLAAQARGFLDDIDTLVPEELRDGPPPTLAALAAAGSPAAAALLDRHARIAAACADQLAAMEFGFLFDESRQLFAIGYYVAEGRHDSSFYDLLASEARLSSFLAVARGEVPQAHWFRLGRGLAAVGMRRALLSWSGTMFEYLMPLIWMRRYPETLLDATYDAAVERQIGYASERGVPWGISESAYNARDLAMNYQYRAFGVPGLGLKAGLSDDLVIAPYASVLALAVRPAATVANLRRLIAAGMLGTYGLYEAIDYTPGRLPPGQERAIIRSFMVHHQGMSLLAIVNALCAGVMQRRFHAEPLVQAAENLLQERLPQGQPLQVVRQAAEEPQVIFEAPPPPRQFTTPHTQVPYTHLLSNGRYSVMLTTAGAGYSACADLAVTRWRADPTCDSWGSFIYVRDARSGALWSAACQPTRHTPQGYQVIYSLEKAEFRQRVAGIDTQMEVIVSPEEDAELRRVTLTNRTGAPRELELTSYAELVLGPSSADEAHPAFANLFVETEYVPEHEALLASRRPRSFGAPRPWAVHCMSLRGHAIGAAQYESDRAAFLGRGRGLADPQALREPLGGHAGAVLDPILSLRRRLRIAPDASAQITFITAVTTDRAAALGIAAHFRDPRAVARVFDLAWTQSQVELRDLDIDAAQAHRFQRLAGAALYPDSRRRAKAETVAANTQGQPALWPYGISGDFPLILAQVGPGDELGLVAELLRAHEYWRLKRLTVDLVILNDDAGGYAQGRQEQILTLVRNGRGAALLNQRGGIFVLRGDLLPAADRTLLEAAARATLSARRGGLAQHLRSREPETPLPPATPKVSWADDRPLPPVDLALPAPFGGFARDDRAYLIDLGPGQATPAPWTNVVANERFGFIVSEAGGGYTWAVNSRENRLSPWSNDPLRDPPGEAIFLRDEDDGAFWSPMRRDQNAGRMRVRHGFGYSSFERHHGTIHSLLTLAVPPDDPLKIFRLRLRNTGAGPARLTATIYVEWVLGTFRPLMAPYIVTDYDDVCGTLFARNPYNVDFAGRVAFVAASARPASYSGDRTTFIGRNGALARPSAMAADQLSGRVGARLDPCGALRCLVEMEPGEERELIFLLGQGDDEAHARALIERYREPQAAAQAEAASVAAWRALLETVQVRTPAPGLDVLLNGWLLYQTLACRVWGRSAFYQSGGAYGFRDQLQDVMALTHATPAVARAQILRAAARQFVEGDVQHWWHPPTGRGIRTRFSDDYLWLPFVALHYADASGEWAIFDELRPFLIGQPLDAGEDERYDLPEVAAEVGTLYEHCARAIDYGLGRMGAHGLPLMGVGDWNDGMNMVGAEGRGESVWVAWFQIAILGPFADLAETRGDGERAARYRAEAGRLRAVVEQHAWDGGWYLRAFYDDGTPLGTSAGDECQIDSLVQSWAVIAGGADAERARTAMAAASSQLVDYEHGLIRLFTPAFDAGAHNPGYIKGYVPGVRENGGQYTHAAIWLIWAYTLLGDGERAGALIELISPVRHAATTLDRYMVEPYVIAADVYTAAGHQGRGGWTWYTGSAGWLYRLGVEQLLGLRRQGDSLLLRPQLPNAWPGFSASYRYGQTVYRISVERGDAPGLSLDGAPLAEARIPLRDDGGEHHVRLVL